MRLTASGQSVFLQVKSNRFDHFVRLQTDLVLSSVLHYLLIDNLIHDLKALDCFFLCDANICLLQGHGAETARTKKTPLCQYKEVDKKNGRNNCKSSWDKAQG